MKLELIVKDITEVYNDSEVKVQQIIKLTWWDDKKYTDEVISKCYRYYRIHFKTCWRGYIKACGKGSINMYEV